MTESYSPVDVIKKFYASENGDRDGAHLPFNFLLISKMTNSSKAADIVKMIDDWLTALPEGKATNWVVSRRTDKIDKNLFMNFDRSAITMSRGLQAALAKSASTFSTRW